MLSEKYENLAFYVVRVASIPLVIRPRDVGDEEPSPALRRPNELDENRSVGREARSAWLFQPNPVLYDLRGALRTLKEQVWSVSKFAKEMKPGDPVYLWEAGKRGGIIEPPRLQTGPPEQLPFAKVAERFPGERMRTRLRILRVIRPLIPRQSFVLSPELNRLGSLRCSRGTNFRVTLDQWRALNSLLQGTVAVDGGDRI